MIRQTFLRWTYALLIRTLPESFRRENAPELMEHFLWLSNRSSGMRGRVRLWRFLLKDVVSTTAVLRRAEMEKRPVSGTRRRLAWSLSGAGAGVLCVSMAVLQFSKASPTGDVLPIAPDSAEPSASPSTEALPTSEPNAPAPVQLTVPNSATSEELSAALEYRRLLSQIAVSHLEEVQGQGGPEASGSIGAEARRARLEMMDQALLFDLTRVEVELTRQTIQKEH